MDTNQPPTNLGGRWEGVTEDMSITFSASNIALLASSKSSMKDVHVFPNKSRNDKVRNNGTKFMFSKLSSYSKALVVWKTK